MGKEQEFTGKEWDSEMGLNYFCQHNSLMMKDYSAMKSIPLMQANKKESVQKNKYFPGFIQAVGLIILVYLLPSILLVTTKYLVNISLYNNFIFRTIVTIVSFSVVLFFFRRHIGMQINWSIIFRHIKTSSFILIVTSIIGIIILSAGINYIIQYLFNKLGYIHNPYDYLMSKSFIFFYITIVIIFPVLEELFFSGLILPGFIRRYSTSKALILISILFCFSHKNLYQLPGAFLLRLFISWLFIKSNSLVPCISAHVLSNLLTVIALRFVFVFPDYLLLPDYVSGWMIVGVGCGCVAIYNAPHLTWT